MNHILHLIERARQMTEQQPTPTEKSQIVIGFISNPQPLVVRFNSVKRGEAARDKLVKAWSKWRTGYITDGSLHHVAGDMFTTDVDLTTIATVSFVDQSKRDKFIPVT